MIDADELRFSGIVGHERTIDLLKGAIAGGRVAHAYIFVGPEGVGKRRTAHAFAAALLCTNLKDEACGQCLSCKKLISGNHPDFHEIFPEETGMKVIKIKTVREEIIPAVYMAPSESEKKVFIINEADRIQVPAVSAFLKTLEEPSLTTVFILLTSVPQVILRTILSRCQKVAFGALPADELAKLLVSKRGWREDQAALAARLSEGSVGAALAMDENMVFTERPRIGKMFFGLESEDPGAALALAQELVDWPQGIENAFEMIKTFLADAVLIRAGVSRVRTINRDLADDAAAFGSRYQLKVLSAKVRSVTYAQRLIARNASKLLTAEAMLLDVTSHRVSDFAERMPR